MEHCGLSKDDKDALFESLHVLRRLSEECFASDATDSNRPVQIATETAPCVRQQTFLHVAPSVAQTTSSNDRRQTTADAIPDERSPTSRAARSSNALETARVDLMAKSFDHHDVVPLSFYSTVTRMNERIQHTMSKESAKRHSNDRFIASATNGCQTTRVSKR